MLELLARTEVLLRRASARPLHGSPLYEFDWIRVNFEAAEVEKDGDTIHLSALEFRLLKYLIEHRGTVLSREELMQKVWNSRAVAFSRTVDLHIAWLKRSWRGTRPVPVFCSRFAGWDTSSRGNRIQLCTSFT